MKMASLAGRIRRVPRLVAFVSSLAAMTIVVRVAGFADKVILASFFDLADMEVFFIAVSLPTMVYTMVAALVNPVLVPGFVSRLAQKDGKTSAEPFYAWLFLLGLVLSASAGFIYAFAGPLASVLAPGFAPEKQRACALMLRVMAPLSAVMGLTPLFAAFLNAQRRFVVRPLGELAMKLVGIAAVVGLGGAWGIRAALWGAAGGMLAYLAVEAAAMRAVWSVPPSLAGFKQPDFRRAFALMAAPVVGTVFARIGEIVERAAASTLTPGSVAALMLSRKLVDLPLLIIPMAAATVLFTFFSELHEAGAQERVARMLDSATRIMLLIFLPITVLTCILAEPIVAVVYQRGEFEAESVHLVGQALFWLAPSMSFLAVEMLLMRHFFSRRDVWTPTLVGVGCTGARVAAIYVLMGPAGLAGVAAAITASRALKVAILVCILHRVRIMHRLRRPQRLGRAVAESTKLAVATGVSAVAAIAVMAAMRRPPEPSLLGQIGLMTAVGSMGAVAYAGSLAVLWQGKFKEMILWEGGEG